VTCSVVGADVADSLRDVICWVNWPISSWRELIKESFSVSEDFNEFISLSLEVRDVVCCAISDLYLS